MMPEIACWASCWASLLMPAGNDINGVHLHRSYAWSFHGGETLSEREHRSTPYTFMAGNLGILRVESVSHRQLMSSVNACNFSIARHMHCHVMHVPSQCETAGVPVAGLLLTGLGHCSAADKLGHTVLSARIGMELLMGLGSPLAVSTRSPSAVPGCLHAPHAVPTRLDAPQQSQQVFQQKVQICQTLKASLGRRSVPSRCAVSLLGSDLDHA